MPLSIVLQRQCFLARAKNPGVVVLHGNSMGLLEEADGLKFVRLGNGRRICYREQGVPGEEAKRQLMVVHGLGSSRLAGMPGVSDALLKAYGLKIVAIDRPGYGRSDSHQEQTIQSTAHDIEEVADTLCMGEKFWLLGYSGGGAFCWGSARYIPHRIAGIGLWAPVGNYYWKGITEEERTLMWSGLTSNNKFIFGIGRHIPSWVLRLYVQHFVKPGIHWLHRLQLTLSAPDKQHLQVESNAAGLIRDNLESMTWNKGFGMAKDIKLFNADWGFEPQDVANVYKGTIHIWQGMEDNLVPIGLQRWVRDNAPELVRLYELTNEGHLSWFCYNLNAHQEVFRTLFGEDIPVNQEPEVKSSM